MNAINIIFPSVSFIFVSGLIIFLLSKKIYNTLFILLIALLVCTDFWLFGTAQMFHYVDDDQAVLFWDRFVYLGVTLIPAVYLHFIFQFTRVLSNLQPWRKVVLFSTYVISIFFCAASRTTLFINGVFYYTWGTHSQAKILHHFFLIFFEVSFILGLWLLYKYHQFIADRNEKQRTKYIFVAFIFLYGVGSIAYLPAYNISIYPIPFLSATFFTGVIVYAITRYRLFNVQTILKQRLLKITLIVAVSLIGASLIYVVFVVTNYSLLLLFITTIIIFCIIQFFVSYLSEHYLMRDTLDLAVPQKIVYQDVLVQKHIDSLLKNINATLGNNVKDIQNITLCIKDWRNKIYQSMDSKVYFSEHHALIHFFKTNPASLVLSEQDIAQSNLDIGMQHELNAVLKKKSFTHALAIRDKRDIYGFIFFTLPSNSIEKSDVTFKDLAQWSQTFCEELRMILQYDKVTNNPDNLRSAV